MNRVAFTIFNFNIYYYSLCILCGVIVAYTLIRYEVRKHRINKNLISDLMFYTLLIGILGARIYYVLFNLDYYLMHKSEIFMIHNGGLAIHGGIIFGLIFSYLYCKKKEINYLRFLDICAPALMLAQAIGRWGNFFNSEAHGSITTLVKLKELHIPDFIINGMYIDGNYYYPTFFFESIWCVIGFIIIMLLRKNKNIKLGTQIGFYFIFYGIGRFFIENIRTDSLMLLNLKVAMIISVIGIIFGIILLVFSRRQERYYRE